MITNLEVSRTLAKAKLILVVDASRPPSDSFKLPAALLALITADLAALESGDSSAHAAEGGRAGASASVRAAFEKIEVGLRAGYTGIAALIGDSILPTGISDADRLATFTTYGWERQELGRFTDERLLVLAELALQGETTITNPAWRYSPALVTLISSQLDLIEDEEPDATGGERQVSVSGRKSELQLLQTRLSRARYHYCAASDDLDATKELAKISFQPRRPKGTAAAPPVNSPPPNGAP
jgi:hypothetical protein